MDGFSRDLDDRLVFKGLGSLSLLIQRCKKGLPRRNLFDGRPPLPDERRIYPTKGGRERPDRGGRGEHRLAGDEFGGQG